MKERSYLNTATDLVLRILSSGEPTSLSLSDIFAITSEKNDEVLYGHIKALANIFNKALEELKAKKKFNEIVKEEEKNE